MNDVKKSRTAIKEEYSMKMCHSEAMKLIKELEEKKNMALRNEDNRSRVSYKVSYTHLTLPPILRV